MLTVETIRKIRLASRDGKSIRQVAKQLNLSRNTVRKVLRSNQTAFTYERKQSHKPKLGAYIPILEQWLEAEQDKPRRRSAQLLYEALQGEGYRGSYDQVRRFVKHWREAHSTTVKDAYIPLSFDPGEAYQFDWSHEQVILGGVPTTIKVAHVRLCHSRMFRVIAYPRESQEMVLDAHQRAFTTFGGSCRRGLYDNMKTAVIKILKGKERDFNRRFEEMCSHYLVEPVACTPAAGWEKGQVENQVGVIRRRFFTPIRKAKDLDTLNEDLQRDCEAWVKRHPHPQMKDQTVWQVFEAERDALIPLAQPFDGYAERSARVSTTSMVSYDNNRYSVHCRAVGKAVQLRCYADRLSIWHDDECIGEHRRQFGRGQMIFDPWHYLSVLKHKPGALRNGAPFKHWDLPRALQRMGEQLKRHSDWDRQFVAILSCVPQYGLDAVNRACDLALMNRTISADVVLNTLSRQASPPDPEPIDVAEHLQLKLAPQADCARYDRFRKGVTHAS
jgi:transposase